MEIFSIVFVVRFSGDVGLLVIVSSVIDLFFRCGIIRFSFFVLLE